jgi:enoyl-CoA hydratase
MTEPTQASGASTRLVQTSVLDDIALITLARPDVLNALNEALLSQFGSLIREVQERRTIEGQRIKAIVLTGAGRSFAAGADVTEFLGKTAAEVDAFAWKHIQLFSALENLPLPVIALVNGFALGGGNELAMSAHYRIVADNARLGQPEVKLGIIPGYGAMQRLPRLVGPAKAAEMCANGEPVNANSAVALGLAHESVPTATAQSRAIAVARDLVEGRGTLARRNWDEIAAEQKQELSLLFRQPQVRTLLEAPTPDASHAADVRAARLAAARDALLAMRYGYEHGFAEGLRNDARMFGGVVASPGGQEWVKRFLAKDPAQSSRLTLLSAAED